MKKRLGLLVFALGLAAVAAWAPPAEALYPYCNVHCTGMPANANCTCPGSTKSTRCGIWLNVCVAN